ncbi:MAG TPA: hypothetical protein VKX28_27065 [Xanthobacteraceae bacterium]|nr:hypothetical protein [Xanthobacteraceae bacterium]
MDTPRRKRARKYISLREKLAAALSLLLPQELRDELRAAKVPAKSVISMFHQDHNILFALDGADKWWNLTPLLKDPHRQKSRRDTSIVAKVRRLTPEQEEFQRKVLARPCGQHREPTGNWPRGRRLQSRGFERRKKP